MHSARETLKTDYGHPIRRTVYEMSENSNAKGKSVYMRETIPIALQCDHHHGRKLHFSVNSSVETGQFLFPPSIPSADFLAEKNIQIHTA